MSFEMSSYGSYMEQCQYSLLDVEAKLSLVDFPERFQLLTYIYSFLSLKVRIISPFPHG